MLGSKLPTAPLNLAVVSGNAALDFSWTAPTDDGEDLAGTDSILDHVVEYSSFIACNPDIATCDLVAGITTGRWLSVDSQHLHM